MSQSAGVSASADDRTPAASAEPGRSEPHRSIPDAVIQSLKNNVSLLSLCKHYGVAIKKKVGRDYKAICPFHTVDGHPERTASLSISITKNEFYCFSCNMGGDVIKFVMDIEKITFLPAVEKLLALKGSCEPTAVSSEPEKKAESTESSKLIAQSLSDEERQIILQEILKRSTEALRNSKEARTYLEGRGLDPLKLLESYTIGYWPKDFLASLNPADKENLGKVGLLSAGRALFESCLMFPFCKDRRILTMYGRSILTDTTAQTGRHFMLPGKREGLYLPQAGLNPRRPVIITESVIDALSLFAAGITNVMPLLGVNGFLPDHLDYLKSQAFPQVFIALNGDDAGNRAAAQLKQNLAAQQLTSEIIELPAGKDINEMLVEQGPGKLKEWFVERTGETAPAAQPTVWEENSDIWLLLSTHEYRVRNLTAHGVDRLKVNLLVRDANHRSAFHVDTLDLYQARSREHFIASAARLFSLEREPLNTEMNQLITTLEELRMKMNTNGSTAKAYEMSEEEKREALAYLKAPNLLDRIAADFEACGMIGNKEIMLIAFLGALSRLSAKPFGILLIALSGAGKSAIQDTIASMTPPESLLAMTRLTSQTLFYQPKDGLRRKFINIEEDEGAKDSFFALRILLSSQKLSVHSLKTDANTGEYRSYENTVEGPASVMLSTTDLAAFDHETANRFFMLYLDESMAQTRCILDFQKLMAGDDHIRISRNRERLFRLHRNIQRLLKPVMVINRIGNGIEYPAEIINTRRENTKAESLLSTIALLHQYQRPICKESLHGVDTHYIEVTQEDVTAMHTLAGDVLRQSLHTEMSKLCRDLLVTIGALVEDKFEESKALRENVQRWQVSFTRKELMERSHWSMWHLREHLSELMELGYIAPRTGKKGQRFAYSLVEEVVPTLPLLMKQDTSI